MANSTIAEKIAQAESERQRIAANIAAAYDEAEVKGATMPQVQGSANLADTVASIPEAVQPTLITKQISANGTYTAADDNADGYDKVTVNVPSGGEFVHTRDIVLDEDVAELAIEFSENTIAAYLDTDVAIASASGKTVEYIYPGLAGSGVYARISGMRLKNSNTVFVLTSGGSVFSVFGNGLVSPSSVTIFDTSKSRRISFRLYYADSVFAKGGVIKIYECFGKGT